MNSRTTPDFWKRLSALPAHIRRQARTAYALFRQNPSHPGLRFKQVNPGPPPVYSVRVGSGYRAVGTLHGDTVVWYWIGSHAEYDQLLKQS